MTDIFTNQLTATLDAVWGHGQTLTWSEPMPLEIPPLDAQQTALLKAALNLLNWNGSRFNSFLSDNLAIAKIEDLPASKIDNLFGLLQDAIANWHENKIEGAQKNLSILSCRYWQARQAIYPPEAVRPAKKRKKWVLDGYTPPTYPDPPEPPEPEIEPEPEPTEPHDWVDPMDPWQWYQVA